MARAEAQMYAEGDGGVTILYFVDDVLKSSQNNLGSWTLALDAVKALVGNQQITPGVIVSVNIEVHTK